jgi:DNA-binding transcriptional MerR regulator
MKIGQVSQQTGLSADTLRYYEKFGLLDVARNTAGVRMYTQHDISKLRFIQRAQQMDFSLSEIKNLLSMRENPQSAKAAVRKATAQKLRKIEARIKQLSTLRNELQLLINLCQKSEAGCPIIDEINTFHDT